MTDAVNFSAASYVTRMIRAAKLDSALYEEVEADRSATWQALSVVVLSGLAAGIGTIGQFGSLGHVLGGLFLALLGWVIWAAMTYWIGTRVLPEPQTQSDIGELLRTTGFSSAPGLIRVLGAIPGLTSPVHFSLYMVASLWMLVAMVIAVRQALDYTSTWRAVAVCLIGWTVQALILIVTIQAAAS
jgi:hypothetical protein